LVTVHNGGRLAVVDVKSGDEKSSQDVSKERPLSGDVSPLLLAQDGSIAAMRATARRERRSTAWLWSPGAPAELPRQVTPEREGLSVTAIAVTADAKAVVVGWEDGRIEVFDTASLKSLRVINEGAGKSSPEGARSFQMMEDGNLFVGLRTGYTVYDFANGKRLRVVETDPQPQRDSIVYHPESRTIAIRKWRKVVLLPLEAE
jgi:hypothetical protein